MPTWPEDVVQDVALKAQRRWPQLADLDHPNAYLRRMVTNEHLSWRRKWGRIVPRAEVGVESRAPRPHFAEQHADRAELMGELARLPPRQRGVLVLRYYAGLTDAEIADVLGCRASTVRGYAARGLGALRIQRNIPAEHAEEDSRAH